MVGGADGNAFNQPIVPGQGKTGDSAPPTPDADDGGSTSTTSGGTGFTANEAFAPVPGRGGQRPVGQGPELQQGADDNIARPGDRNATKPPEGLGLQARPDVAGIRPGDHGQAAREYAYQSLPADRPKPVNIHTPDGQNIPMTMSRGQDGRPVYHSDDGRTYRQNGRQLQEVNAQGKPVENGNSIGVRNVEVGRHRFNDNAPNPNQQRPERPQRPEQVAQKPDAPQQKPQGKDGEGAPGGKPQQSREEIREAREAERAQRLQERQQRIDERQQQRQKENMNPADKPNAKPLDKPMGKSQEAEMGGKPLRKENVDALGKPGGGKPDLDGPDNPLFQFRGQKPGDKGGGGGGLGGKPGDVLSGKPVGKPGEGGDSVGGGGRRDIDKPIFSDKFDPKIINGLGDPKFIDKIRGLLDKFQDGKLDGLGPRLTDSLKGLTPDQIKDFRGFLLGDKGDPRTIGLDKLDPTLRSVLKDMAEQLGIKTKDGIATKVMLDAMGRPMDKIPTMEQTKALLADITRQLGDKGDLAALITRTLGEKPIDGKPGEFILKLNATDTTMQDLMARLSKDLGGEKFTLAEGKELTGAKVISSAEAILAATQGKPLDPAKFEQGGDVPTKELADAVARQVLGQDGGDDIPKAKLPTDDGTTEKTPYQKEMELLAALKKKQDDDRLKEEKEDREEKEKQERLRREEKERLEREEEEKKKQLALLAAAQRQRYRVQEGDTLASISKKFFGDEKLAGFIFAVNRGFPVKIHKNKKYCVLKVGNVIIIPGQSEVQQYHRGRSPYQIPKDIDWGGIPYSTAEEELAAKFGDGWSQPESNSEKAKEAAEKRVKRLQQIHSILGPAAERGPQPGDRIKYIVRFGDTLRNIAMKHPALADVKLWRLVALVNDLSTDTDFQGTPYVELKRGAQLTLPTPTEIEQYREEQQKRTRLFAFNNTGYMEMRKRACEACGHPTLVTAHHCTNIACAQEFTGEVEDFSPEEEIGIAARFTGQYNRPTGEYKRPVEEVMAHSGVATVVAQPDSTPPSDATTPITAEEVPPAPPLEEPPAAPVPSQIFPISDDTRMIMMGAFENLDAGVTIQLDSLVEGAWCPVVAYEFLDYGCLRHVYDKTGGRRTRPVNLPLPQAQQLASTDLEQNWKTYCDAFLQDS